MLTWPGYRQIAGFCIARAPVIGKLRHLYQEFTVKSEYAYDYGMPQWLAGIDHVLAPLHLERLFLGRHKFYHFRVWYRDKLSQYVKDDSPGFAYARRRPYLNAQGLWKRLSTVTSRAIGIIHPRYTGS